MARGGAAFDRLHVLFGRPDRHAGFCAAAFARHLLCRFPDVNGFPAASVMARIISSARRGDPKADAADEPVDGLRRGLGPGPSRSAVVERMNLKATYARQVFDMLNYSALIFARDAGFFSTVYMSLDALALQLVPLQNRASPRLRDFDWMLFGRMVGAKGPNAEWHNPVENESHGKTFDIVAYEDAAVDIVQRHLEGRNGRIVGTVQVEGKGRVASVIIDEREVEQQWESWLQVARNDVETPC